MNTYKLTRRARSGATIRATASRTADIRGYIHGDARWDGVPIVGGPMHATGFIDSSIWIQDDRGWCVWAGMLDRVFEGS